MKPLAEFASKCDERADKITSRENKKEHIAINKDKSAVRQLQIDGDVIKDENIKKCDYLVLNDDKNTAYFIELKGNKIKDAIQQIDATVKKFEKDLKDYTKNLRIVFSGSVKSGTIREWTKYNKNAKAEREKLEENI